MTIDSLCINDHPPADLWILTGRYTTERDIAIERNEFLARNALKGFPFSYRIKQFFSLERISAKYSLFMFKLEDKKPEVYSRLIALGLPKPY